MTKLLQDNQESVISGTGEGEEFTAAWTAADSTRMMCNPCDFHLPKSYKEVETDQESIGSSEETESPRSVTKVSDWRKKLAHVHYQIRRIREEDLHLGEDISEGFNAKEKLNSIGDWCDDEHQCSNHHHHNPPQFYHNRVNQHMNVVIFSRPILPSSPLSGKNAVRAIN